MRGLELPEAQSNTRTMIYVGDTLSNEIIVFERDAAHGVLQLMQRLPLPAGAAPLTLAPDQRCLYAALRNSDPAVVTLAIDPANGTLSIQATTPVALQFAYMTTDRSGRYLLGASYVAGAFAIYRINPDGLVLPEPTQVTPTPARAHCIVPDRTNRYLFVTSLGGDVILQYIFDASTGRAQPNDRAFIAAMKGSGPRHLTLHPTADSAYVNGELDGSIAVYRVVAATGELHEVQRIDTMPVDAPGPPWAADLHVTPDGRFLYASERRTSTLATFAVRSDSGLLEPRGVIATEARPRSFAVDPNGRFIAVAGEKSQHLGVYELEPRSGALRFHRRYALGAKPAWVTVARLQSEQRGANGAGVS